MYAPTGEYIIKTLYLEDDPDDAELFREILHDIHDDGGPRYFITHQKYCAQAATFLDFEDYDVIFCDYYLSAQDPRLQTCEEFLRSVRESHPDTACILTSADPVLDQMSDWLRRELHSGRIGYIWKRDWSARALQRVIDVTRCRLAGLPVAEEQDTALQVAELNRKRDSANLKPN